MDPYKKWVGDQLFGEGWDDLTLLERLVGYERAHKVRVIAASCGLVAVSAAMLWLMIHSIVN